MRIIVYKGGAQYNAFNRFAEKLADGFMALDHEVDIVNLAAQTEPGELQLAKAFENKPNLVVSFNAIGAEIQLGKQSLYEAVDCHYVGLLLDHPAFHAPRILRSSRKTIFGVVDNSHAEFLSKVYPTRSCFFAPHGGIQHPNHTNTERPIDILFLGTGVDPKKEMNDWKMLPKDFQNILHASYETFLAEPAAWHEIINKVAKGLHIYLPMQLMNALIVQLEIVCRAEYRRRILRELDEAGLKVTIMGNGWDYAKFKHHQLLPSVEFYEALKIMTQSKISLNASPQFFSGSHERVFMAQLNGSLAFTSESSYYREVLKEGEQLLSFNAKTFPRAIEQAKELLASPVRMREIAAAAKQVANNAHTWQHRAEQFLNKFETIAVLQKIQDKQ